MPALALWAAVLVSGPAAAGAILGGLGAGIYDVTLLGCDEVKTCEGRLKVNDSADGVDYLNIGLWAPGGAVLSPGAPVGDRVNIVAPMLQLFGQLHYSLTELDIPGYSASVEVVRWLTMRKTEEVLEIPNIVGFTSDLEPIYGPPFMLRVDTWDVRVGNVRLMPASDGGGSSTIPAPDQIASNALRDTWLAELVAGLLDAADGQGPLLGLLETAPADVLRELSGLARFSGLDDDGGFPDVSINVERRTPLEVPEPATLALLGAGMAGLAASRRRRTGFS